MNEKIKELAILSGGNPNFLILDKVGIEKFAELLVKECAAIQHKRFCEHGDVSWDLLLEHFDIKDDRQLPRPQTSVWEYSREK
jgi:hypothetical protein